MKSILSSLICFLIIFQMIFAPTVAYAQSLSSLLNAGLGGISGGLQPQQVPADPNASANMAALQQNQTPTNSDKEFTFEKLSQIPGLVQYMSSQKPSLNPAALNCTTLMTKINDVNFDGCSRSPTTLNVNFAEAAARAAVYKDQYDKIAKLYTNYSSTSNNQGQAFGVGCMKNVMDILKGYFNFRKGELTKFAGEIDALTAKFDSDSQPYVTGMEDDTAVLEGDQAEGIVSKVKTRNPALLDFGKRFNNPACTSIFAANDFNENGKKNGLNGINDLLKTTIAEKDQGSKYSGQTYMSSNAAVLQDINNLATGVQTQANLNFADIAGSTNPDKALSDFYGNLKNKITTSDNESNSLNASMFTDVTSRFTTVNQTNKNMLATLDSELAASGISSTKADSFITNSNLGGFEQELTNITNKVQNNCIQSNLVGNNSLDNVLGRMDTLSGISDGAKKSASNITARIAQIMNNTSTSIEQKKAKLNQVDAEFGNRYILSRDNEYFYPVLDANGNAVIENGQVKQVAVPAATSETPGTYFGNVMKICQAQFSSNYLGSQLTGKQAIQKLRDLRSSYSNIKTDFVNSLGNQVKTKMISCTNSAMANASTAGSCSSASFNPSGPNFCVANAVKCAGNMGSCTAASQKFVDEIKTDRTIKVNAYNDRIKAYKGQLVRDFGSLLAKFQSEGEALNNALKVGYNAPAGIQTEVNEANRYLASFKNATNGQLLVEDPKELAKMFRSNIDALIKSVDAQQAEIMQPSSLLNAQIETTKKNYEKVADDAAKFAANCDAGKAFFTKALQDQAAAAQKLGEQRNGVCSLYAAGDNNNPASFCTGNIEDVMSVDKTAGSKLKLFCNKYNNHDSENNGNMDADRICQKNTNKEISSNLTTLCKQIDGLVCREEDPNDDATLFSDTSTPAKLQAARDAVTRRNEVKNCPGKIEKLAKKVVAAYDNHLEDSVDPKDLPEAPKYCVAGQDSDRGDVLDQAISTALGQNNAAPGTKR
jgi:hypothetical protein